MYKLLYVLIVSLTVVLFTACGSNEGNIENRKGILKVGMELAYPPFEMSDKNGVPTGISVDLAKALAKDLGKELVIENIAWEGLIPSLKTNKIDLIISSMTITQERRKSIEFSIPYSQTSLAILANKNSNVKNINDLNQKGKVVAVKKGSTGHVYARDHLKNATLLMFDKESACVLEVVQGKADGFIYGQLTVHKNHSKHKDTTVALLEPFEDDFQYWGIALRQNEPILQGKVNAFIKKAKEDGTFDKLSYKYLQDVRKTFDELNIPFFF